MRKKELTRRRALAGLGSLASTAFAGPDEPQPADGAALRVAPREELVNVLEFESVAAQMLAPAVFSEISGSDRAYFDRITLRPRMMVPTTKLDLTTELFGEKLFAPIIAGPMARLRTYHPDSEVAVARGATAAKALMIASSQSSDPIERIAAEAKAGLWYQVFPEGETSAIQAQIKQAVRAGAKAICLTVGAPYRNGKRNAQGTRAAAPVLNWSVVDQIRQGLSVPFILKGIMTAEEADAAVKRGVQGIVVSNYGGILAPGLAPPLEMLSGVVDAVGRRVPVLIDGNFRRGSDMFKALALGASAVLVGRPVVWGLAAYGAEGVQSVLEMLQTELARDMAQCGKPNLKTLDATVLKVHEA
ncbi:MAG: alpha-hydroxy-acid oxidizing protein [Candidatus Solibacter sp.]